MLVKVPKMSSIRRHLSYVGSVERTVTKDSVVSDMHTVLLDMDTRSALNALIPHLNSISVLFPVSYRVALSAIREPYIRSDAPSYSKSAMNARPDMSLSNAVAHLKVSNVKAVLKAYDPKSENTLALESALRIKCHAKGLLS